MLGRLSEDMCAILRDREATSQLLKVLSGDADVIHLGHHTTFAVLTSPAPTASAPLHVQARQP